MDGKTKTKTQTKGKAREEEQQQQQQQQQADENLAQRTTLLREPERDPGKALIEETVEVSELSVLGPDIFTNTHPPWVPTGARGVYGGTVIAQSLAAAQRTVPDDFLAHSCHCYFLLAGSGTVPILYHVERVRDGRSYMTRTVQARQRGRCIFTVTVSFARHEGGEEEEEDKKKKEKRLEVRHAVPLPAGLEMPEASWDEDESDAELGKGGGGGGGGLRGGAGKESENENENENENSTVTGMAVMTTGPLLTRHVANQGMHGPPDTRRCRRWIRCRGTISASGGHRAHLSALAYLSDSNLINTVARIHQLWRHPIPPERVAKVLPPREEQSLRARWALDTGSRAVEEWAGRPRAGMIVSLDHSIYFHEPGKVRADEWMFTEMESPWSGDGRGVVMMRVFARDGTLLASCVQEGVVRLREDGGEVAGKM